MLCSAPLDAMLGSIQNILLHQNVMADALLNRSYTAWGFEGIHAAMIVDMSIRSTSSLLNQQDG